MSDSSGEKVAIIGTHDFESSELERPLEALRNADVQVGVVTLQHGEIKGWEVKDWGWPVKVDRRFDEVTPDEHDAPVIPGARSIPAFSRPTPRPRASLPRLPPRAPSHY